MREARHELLDRLRHRGHVAAGRVRIGVAEQRAVGRLEQRERVGLVAQPHPRRRVLGSVSVALVEHRPAAAGGRRGPVTQVQPQRAVVELVDAVVAEQVGVGEHDDPPLPVRRGHDQRGSRDRRRRVRAREHDGAVAARDRRRPVQAGRVHAREQIATATASPALQVGEHPARSAHVVLVVLDGVVLEMQPEPLQQLVEVVAVLVLLGLAEHDQPAAARDERLDRVELGGAQPRRPGSGRPLPARVRRMRDHEHAGAGQRLLGQRPLGVGARRRSRARRARPRRARTTRRRDGRAASRARARGGSSTPRCGPRRRRHGRAFRIRSWPRGYPGLRRLSMPKSM